MNNLLVQAKAVGMGFTFKSHLLKPCHILTHMKQVHSPEPSVPKCTSCRFFKAMSYAILHVSHNQAVLGFNSNQGVAVVVYNTVQT
jgi:hypothetical protein